MLVIGRSVEKSDRMMYSVIRASLWNWLNKFPPALKLTFLHNALRPSALRAATKLLHSCQAFICHTGFESLNETEVLHWENLSFILLLAKAHLLSSYHCHLVHKNHFCPKLSTSRQELLIKSLFEEIKRSYLGNNVKTTDYVLRLSACVPDSDISQ